VKVSRKSLLDPKTSIPDSIRSLSSSDTSNLDVDGHIVHPTIDDLPQLLSFEKSNIKPLSSFPLTPVRSYDRKFFR
jgi:hypothetical protein